MKNRETLSNNENALSKTSKFEQILDKMPSFFEHIKSLRAEHRSDGDVEAVERCVTKQNQEFQAIYDLVMPEQEDWKVLQKLQELNCTTESPFLASGQSSYFNQQIDEHSMNGLKLRDGDIEDAYADLSSNDFRRRLSVFGNA